MCAAWEDRSSEHRNAAVQGHRYPVEIINRCVWLYFRFPLSFRQVEELMRRTRCRCQLRDDPALVREVRAGLRRLAAPAAPTLRRHVAPSLCFISAFPKPTVLLQVSIKMTVARSGRSGAAGEGSSTRAAADVEDLAARP